MASESLSQEQEGILNVNVGVLGHVDSGKTSLVKTLSTLLSTAALDKSKQSRQRGMTLDLGFSCFFFDLPQHLKEKFPEKKKLQVTLVDCPGHASLIRTIIGGAQIIDMVLLVVDAYKGWQAQTTECLVLAELTSRNLVVALNKIDLFDPKERDAKLDKVKSTIQRKLQSTRFATSQLIGVSACVGGEKVAAISPDKEETGNTVNPAINVSNETYNMDRLIKILTDEIPAPKRTPQGSFYFSIDHCFPIRGRGTVLTGTVLNGSTSVNDVLEFPTLGLERKIKSMQMFKRQVNAIQQGDRAGICVSNLDSKLLERGIASSPGAVQLLKGALVLVRKVKYYPGKLTGNSKFHISVGHATVMATVTFWGARELAEFSLATGSIEPTQNTSNNESEETDTNSNKAGSSKQHQQQRKSKKPELASSSLGGNADIAGLPQLQFDFNQNFMQQENYVENLSDHKNIKDAEDTLLNWAMLDFQIPVHCPLNSLIIGSRLDFVDSSNTNAKDTGASPLGESASSCRLAFCGRIIEKMDPEKDTQRIRLYTSKERRGVISRLGDPYRRSDDKKVVRYEVFGTDLFKKETNMKIFIGMKVCAENNRTGVDEIGEIKSSFGTSGKFRVFFPAGTEAREGDALILKFKRFANDPQKLMHQSDIILPDARPGTRLDSSTTKNKGKNKKGGMNNNNDKSKRNAGKTSTTKDSNEKKTNSVIGEVVSIKGDKLSNNKHNMAIISGFFTPEVNIREKAGLRVTIPTTNEEGKVAGPFGKAGKCKVSFENGISESAVGSKAELHIL